MKKIERMKKHSRMLKSVCMKPFASMKLPTLTVRILSTLCALTMVGLAAQAQLLYKISGKDAPVLYRWYDACRLLVVCPTDCGH